MYFSTPSQDDGLELYPWLQFGIGQDSLPDRTPIDPRIDPDEKTFILVTLGQSLICNSVLWTQNGVYSPTNGTKVQNFNFINGGLFTAKDDLLGCHGTGANAALWLADKLVTDAGYDRVILAPIGFSSSGSGQWAVGGNMNHRIPVLAKRLTAAGYTPDAILWQQGTADAGSFTTKASTQANIQSMIDTFRGVGLTCPMFIALESYISPTQPSWSPTRAAQKAVVNASANVFTGPDADMIGGDLRFDGTHFSYDGAAYYAELAYAAITAVIPLPA